MFLSNKATVLKFNDFECEVRYKIKFMTVNVVPYNSSWPQLFQEEAERIKQVLGENCFAVHHIGSTAVPGLAAKPVIDILPVVNDIMAVEKMLSAMEVMGYVVKGEYGIPFRRFFQKGNPIRTHNVHVFEKSNPEIERHLMFRDWMRTHKNDAETYAALKIALAEKFPNDITTYCLGKEEFIAKINAAAGFNKPRMVQALTDREWQAVRHFRQKYFFDKVPVSDPYTWTFNHVDHIHFVFYQGSDIIGYAHIQLWADKRAALRIIVMDEAYRRQGTGSYFLALMEKWLKSRVYVKLQTQSSPDAYGFYVRNQYIEMAFNDSDNHGSDPRDIEMGKIL